MSIRDRIWGTGKRATQEEVVELTNQFYVTLRAYFTQIKNEGENNVKNKDAFNRIKALLEPEQGEAAVQNWTNAYEIEQLLVHLFDDDTIATELAIRMLEARSILRPELAATYEAHVNEIENPPAGGERPNTPAAPVRRRRLLARLVNDLQWRYIVNEAKRRYTKLITRRTATLSLVALVVFVAAIVMIATRQFTQFNYGDLHLLWVAGLAGTWGATFSMLATLRSRLGESKFDDLKLMKAGSVLLSRAAIGAGAACILFFFLVSGLLGGSAFPSLAKPSDEARRAAAAGNTPSSPTSTTQPAPSSTPTTGTSTTQPAPGSTPTTATSTTPPALGSTPPTPTSTTQPVPSSNPSTGASTTTPPARGTAPSTGQSTAAPAQQGPPGPAGAEAGRKPEDRSTDRGGPPALATQSASAAEAIPLLTTDLALLIVWCFIAGFSEQLIPGLLATTEARAGTPPPSSTDRFRPTTGTTQVAPPPTPQTAGPSGQAKPSETAAGKAQPESGT
jgi:hypothetical protein